MLTFVLSAKHLSMSGLDAALRSVGELADDAGEARFLLYPEVQSGVPVLRRDIPALAVELVSFEGEQYILTDSDPLIHQVTRMMKEMAQPMQMIFLQDEGKHHRVSIG